ncbi:MAG: hypothetical protein II398_02455, partial [Prevotella sp.]|nr:hypothetical protein [Prevotella sp.]
MKKTILLMTLLLMAMVDIKAQAFNGVHKFDGEHKNELSGYLMGGHNVVTREFVGVEGSYKRHLTDRWHVGGDWQLQFFKQLYSVDVQGGYRLPIGWSDFYFDGKLMYNRYNRTKTNEIVANLSITWETPYFNLRIGESYLHYHLLHFGYTEPLTF